jgi:hypothetical protein
MVALAELLHLGHTFLSQSNTRRRKDARKKEGDHGH